ncbi:Rv0361 family membrane protein [Mycobacterium haemophilum]
MPNAPEPDRGVTPNRPGFAPRAVDKDVVPDQPETTDDPADDLATNPGEEITEGYPLAHSDSETETVVITKPEPDHDAEPDGQQHERRFTAPGFDASATAIIATTPDPATEVIHPPPTGPPEHPGIPMKAAVPQSIPPRPGTKLRTSRHFNWGWVLALIVIVLALAAIAILGTVLLTRGKHVKASPADQVRRTIQSFDVAVQTGDLTTLRSITCGTTRDGYVEYDERSWDETYRRVSAAKQYPVIASIDQIVVNGQHAEANITTFMAYDPQVRSTRSLDLQFRDDQWKICQSPSG